MPNAAKKFEKAPCDLYCPSMAEKIDQGICKVCHQYWPTQAAMLRHRKGHRKVPVVMEEEEAADGAEEEELTEEEEEASTSNRDEEQSLEMPVFNIFELLENPAFVEDDTA